MQLVVGGAYSGKRKLVKAQYRKHSWLTAYEGDLLCDWKTSWAENSTLILEGWEIWIANELKKMDDDVEIRKRFQSLINDLKVKEQKRNDTIVIIMLEVGRGIVPINKEERRVRDLLGWLLQDVANHANDVQYVWHGLAKKIK
ncbi:hypothetical protein BKP45_00785 [Anaerobacillus alkalidiazotrophicus]|uniref:Adenosylcobinamide kinase n=1 Tax=Anaerobacillus alkalidiazotrophicus TaxID=472963 RepID=A0A1S2M9W7_9BACI|nr:bifunctional adenosylcobinamide kinase/adenosylcobinamide-phosphate guanylyltransferase [Anaerobacillus alkalidiazotrophicus]OIJ21350.1 hypothetical protein BKP45_00785 [Anaerobacillus alkalidiazotrophicus]